MHLVSPELAIIVIGAALALLVRRDVGRILSAVDRVPSKEWFDKAAGNMERIPTQQWQDRMEQAAADTASHTAAINAINESLKRGREHMVRTDEDLMQVRLEVAKNGRNGNGGA